MYQELRDLFMDLFYQELSDEDIRCKRPGIIGDEALPLGNYVWGEDEKGVYLEYYVSWIPHYRGDSHGKIYTDGTHEHLPTLPQIGEVTPEESALRRELEAKGLI